MNIQAWAGLGTIALAACSAAGTSPGAAGSSTSSGGGTAGGGGGGDAPATTVATTGSGATSTTAGSSSSGTGTPDAGVAASDVTVYVTPDPSVITTIAEAIDSATTLVHMTMYILDNDGIVTALASRAKAGIAVEVVMNQTFPAGTVQSNPTTYTTLTQAGAKVVWRNGPPNAASGAYTHEKTFIVDGKQAWIMTINLDGSAAEYNREYIVVDNTPADVAEADAIFTADFNGTASTWGSPLVVSPDPPCNSRSALVALIDSATKTLDVEVEEFSDNYTGGVTSAVAAAAKRGVTTRVILANTTAETSQETAIKTVKAAGAKVVISGGTSGGSTPTSPYIHAKAITVDCTGTTCARGFLGSENFSAGSLGYNRELGIVIDNATELAKVETAINADYAAGTMQ